MTLQSTLSKIEAGASKRRGGQSVPPNTRNLSGAELLEKPDAKPKLSHARPGHWRNQWLIRHPRMWAVFGLFDAEDQRDGDYVTCHRKHASEAIAERVARRELKSIGFINRQLLTYLGPKFYPEGADPPS